MVLTKETSLFKKDAIADDLGEAVIATVSVYMRKNASQTAPSKPTASTYIGTSPTTDGAWEYVMPYPKKNFKFYTCEQYTKVDGTKEYSDVRELSSETYISKWVHDADATYIDGGSLYTNSVTADKIQAGAITIGKLSNDALYNVIYTVSTEHAVSEYPYIKLCTIQTVRAYQNKDVVFSISSRLSRMDTEINWAFNNSSSATASVVSHAYKTGATPVFYASEGNGKYGIYVSKADKYENLQVHDLYNPYPNGITIEWLGTEVTSLPSGYVAFTELAGSRPASDIDDAAETATTYITHIDDNGIRIHPSSTENNSVVINSDGMEVFKGGTTDAYSVAQYGDSARIGKLNKSRVDISSSGISMSDDSNRTIYSSMSRASNKVKITRTYNIEFAGALVDYYDEEIGLGRTVSSWSSIVLTYKVNDTQYTKTYTSMPISDDAKYWFFASNYESTVNIQFGKGGSATTSETITLVSIALEFITAQQVVESTIGAFSDTSIAGPLIVGNGTSSSAKSNAMAVDWGGRGTFGGDVVAYANSDGSGGVSLAYIRVFGGYDGTVNGCDLYIQVVKVGRLVMLQITFTKTSSTASGSNIAKVDVTNTSIPKPFAYGASGMTYYGAHAIGLVLNYEGDVNPTLYFTIRNASNSAVTPSGNGYGSLMYITDDDTEPYI